MNERLARIKLKPQRMLDAGCGEGDDVSLLNRRFPEADVVALDAAFGMADVAKRTHGNENLSRRHEDRCSLE